MKDEPASSSDPSSSTTRILGRKAGALFDLGLGTPGAEAGERSSEPDAIAPGQMVGKYRIVKKLGEGGFGAVWQAEQMGLAKMVAVKLIKPGMDSRQVIARFEAERQALSLMSHPNIATVLDAGTTPQGHPYFVMEMVHGISITRYCDQNRLSVTERLKVFQNVCLAMQHAHQKAILHRDIKPSNILVEEVDGLPVPKIIDFGIAKALGQSNLGGDSSATMSGWGPTGFGAFLGTPPYMSPEQANSGFDVDTRSDIYSLGVVLFELLTGQTHIPVDRFKNASVPQMISLINDSEAPRPSHLFVQNGDSERVTKHAETRGGNPQTLTQTLRGDLDWIVLKAIEKDRNRRYESAAALADDIDRHLHDQPVVARPPSRLYVLQKMVRRNRAAVFAIALAVVALVAGSAAAVVGMLQARDALQKSIASETKAVASEQEAVGARKRAEASEKIAKEEAEKSRQTLDFMTNLFEDFDKGSMSAGTFRELLVTMDERRKEKLAAQPEADMEIARVLARGFASVDDLAAAEEQFLNVRRRLQDLGRSRSEEAADCLFQIAWIGERRARDAPADTTRSRDLELLTESIAIRKALPPAAASEAAARQDELIRSEALMVPVLLRLHDPEGAKARLAPFQTAAGEKLARNSGANDWLLRASALVARHEGRFDDAETLLDRAEDYVKSSSLRTLHRMEAEMCRLRADLFLARGDLPRAEQMIEKERVKRLEWLDAQHPGTLLRLADVQWKQGNIGKARDSLNRISSVESSLRLEIPEGEEALRKLVEIEKAALPLNDAIRLANVQALADRLRKRADSRLVQLARRKVSEVEERNALAEVRMERAKAEELLAPHLQEPFDDRLTEYGVRDRMATLAACKEDYKTAVAFIEKGLELTSNEFEDRFRLAVFLSAAGEGARFAAERTAQAAQISPPPGAAASGGRPVARVFDQLKWLWRTVLLTPGLALAELDRMHETLFARGAQSQEEAIYDTEERDEWRALLTGWARFRAGQHAEAEFPLEQAGKSRNKVIVVQSQLLSAMNVLRLGEGERAQGLLVEAEATWKLHIKPYEHTDSAMRLHDVLAVSMLLAEAQALFQPKPPQ